MAQVICTAPRFLQIARSLALTVLVALLHGPLAGCSTSAKLDSFNELSKAGVVYADAANAVIAQAADGSINADSATLVVGREGLSTERRREELCQSIPNCS